MIDNGLGQKVLGATDWGVGLLKLSELLKTKNKYTVSVESRSVLNGKFDGDQNSVRLGSGYGVHRARALAIRIIW